MPLSPKKKISLYTSLIISSTTLAGCLPDISFSSSNNRDATTRVESFVPETPSTTDTSVETSEQTSEAQNSQESTTPTQNDVDPSTTPKSEESSSVEKTQEQESSATTSQAQESSSENTSQATAPVESSVSSEVTVSSTSITTSVSEETEKPKEQEDPVSTSKTQEPTSQNTSEALAPVNPTTSSEPVANTTSTTSTADKEEGSSTPSQTATPVEPTTSVDPVASSTPTTSTADTLVTPSKEETLDENVTKVELNYIDSVALYQVQGETSSQVSQLSSVPGSTDNFYVVINNKLSKPIYVKVKKFEEAQHNGQNVIKAQLDLSGLIHRNNSSVVEGDFVYIPKTASTGDLNKRSLDLSTLPDYKSENAIAYENMTRLLPFYNREKIIQYGNKVSTSDPLYTQRITNIIPMVDDQFVIDVKSAQTTINKLFILFGDNSYRVYELTGGKSSAANSSIVEYQLGGDDLIYTPNTFTTDNSEILDKVVGTFKAINYNSKEVAEALEKESDFGESWFNTRLERFRLEESFNSVRDDIGSYLSKILAADGVLTTSDPVINQQYIKKLNDNAAEIMLALSYLQRWYDIDFGSYNIRDLTTFKLDFFGDKNISTLDVLINLGKNDQGKIDWGNILPIENVKYYEKSLSQYTDAATLFDYLERYRQLFLPGKTNNQWLVDSSKAHIVEKLSTVEEAATLQQQVGTSTSIGVYDRIKNSDRNGRYQHMLLPLLTLKDENMYVIATMGALSMGGYEPYYTDLTESNRQRVRALVDKTAEEQRNVFDFWYKILNENDRKKMFQNMLNYDTFLIDGQWRNLYADYGSIQQFFGPVEISKPYQSHLGAYALPQDQQSFFFGKQTLGDLGTTIFSHEMVHLFDENIYLSGHGRRPGMGPEAYADGLFESSLLTSGYLGINQAFIGQKNDTSRYHVADPISRFQDNKDLQEYMSGMFDVLYLMEYLEGEAMVKQSTTIKTRLLRKVENHYPSGSGDAWNKVKTLSNGEADELQKFDDLVKNNILTRRSHDAETVNRDPYNATYYSASNWAALSNDQGAPGGLMFKRMAMELLAEKGYYEGMLPYISDMLKGTTYNVTDQEVLNHVFAADNYGTWADFKLAMYHGRVEKAEKYVRPVTIQYNPKNWYGTGTTKITSLKDLQECFEAAVRRDAGNGLSAIYAQNSHVSKLKEAIYKAYLVDTDDFRESIFEKPANE